MLKRMIGLAAVLSLASDVVFAQTAATPPQPPAIVADTPPSAHQIAMGRELAAVGGGRESMDEFIDQTAAELMIQVKEQLGESDTAEARRRRETASSALQEVQKRYVELMADASAKAYAKVYTEQELNSIADFLKSPAGQAFFSKAEEASEADMQATLELVPTMRRDMVDAVCDRIRCTKKTRAAMLAAESQ